MTPDASRERPGRPPSPPSQEDIHAPYDKGRVTASPCQRPARNQGLQPSGQLTPQKQEPQPGSSLQADLTAVSVNRPAQQSYSQGPDPPATERISECTLLLNAASLGNAVLLSS